MYILAEQYHKGTNKLDLASVVFSLVYIHISNWKEQRLSGKYQMICFHKEELRNQKFQIKNNQYSGKESKVCY